MIRNHEFIFLSINSTAFIKFELTTVYIVVMMKNYVYKYDDK